MSGSPVTSGMASPWAFSLSWVHFLCETSSLSAFGHWGPTLDSECQSLGDGGYGREKETFHSTSQYGGYVWPGCLGRRLSHSFLLMNFSYCPFLLNLLLSTQSFLFVAESWSIALNCYKLEEKE